MKLPPTEQIDIAVAWLECNEGEGQEGEACRAVAAYLEHQNKEAFLRREARAQGVPVARLRRKLENGWKKNQHWHEHNPWADFVVYVPIEELATCAAGGKIRLIDGRVVPFTTEIVLMHWRKYGDKLDAYILPQPSGDHSIGVRYGQKAWEYASPMPQDRVKLAALLEKYRH